MILHTVIGMDVQGRIWGVGWGGNKAQAPLLVSPCPPLFQHDTMILSMRNDIADNDGKAAAEMAHCLALCRQSAPTKWRYYCTHYHLLCARK